MKKLPEPLSWAEANQQYLLEALSLLRTKLEQYIEKRYTETQKEIKAQKETPNSGQKAKRKTLKKTTYSMPTPAAIETLCTMFGLSPFEQEVLLLCAGVELDSSFAFLCAEAQGDSSRKYPTFGLALAALTEPHWSALTPAAPLRRWNLIEIRSSSSNSLISGPLQIDERILHYLTGVHYLDERLTGFVEPLLVQREHKLVNSHKAIATRIIRTWALMADTGPLPVIQLCGNEIAVKKEIAALVCASLRMNLNSIAANFIPTNPIELDSLIRLLERESALGGSVLLLDCENVDSADQPREKAIDKLVSCISSPLVICSRERRTARNHAAVSFDIRKPTSGEQKDIWRHVLGTEKAGLDDRLGELVSQFNFNTQTIQNACTEAISRVSEDESNIIQHENSLTQEKSIISRDKSDVQPAESSVPQVESRILQGKNRTLQAENIISKENTSFHEKVSHALLWDACRKQARFGLEDLALHMEPAADWEDLVLPAAQKKTLREIEVHVRQRDIVYENWGFADRSSRGLGITALFTGSSGTGKTMAAEVLAKELKLDLYRIDLSQIVSKYIGETEKNLRRIFDAAEEGGAILLFDEADALFGKRSEVRDSHDRYANIEVSYLLQRMEAYRGLAILTTNMKNALDPAFLRRIRFVVQFPFPGSEQRFEIWKRVFPEKTPTYGLDLNKLARLNVTGGNISNIALSASFLAVEAGVPVGMPHILQAARAESAKLERPLTEAEIGGWV